MHMSPLCISTGGLKTQGGGTKGATKSRVFKECATKGRVLNTKCMPERVWFFQWLTGLSNSHVRRPGLTNLSPGLAPFTPN